MFPVTNNSFHFESHITFYSEKNLKLADFEPGM